MVKAAKKAIYAVLRNSDINDEQLMTIFIAAETFWILDSWQRTVIWCWWHSSADAKSFSVRTDGRSVCPGIHRNIWFSSSQRDGEKFNIWFHWYPWRTWLKEYLPMLTSRPHVHGRKYSKRFTGRRYCVGFPTKSPTRTLALRTNPNYLSK